MQIDLAFSKSGMKVDVCVIRRHKNIVKNMHKLSFFILVLGGINWLLLGVIGWEIGQLFGGSGAVVSRIVYVIVGLAAIYELATHKGSCKTCSVGSGHAER